MFSKTLAVGTLAAGCLVGAAGGAYVASRGSGNGPSASPAAAATTPPVQAADSSRPVAETEALVTQPEAAPVAPPLEAVSPERPVPVAAASPSASRRASSSVARPEPRARAENTRARNSGSRTERPASEARPSSEPVREPSPAPAAREVREPPAATPIAEPTAVPVEPPAPQYEELIVPAASVIGLRVDTLLTTERAQVEDRVSAQVTRDVMADGRVAVPAGSRAIGSVILVERGGKMKDRARLGVRFHTLVLADGTELPVTTEAIYREGESPSGESTRKIGGAAVGGAILGALIGGKKGAIVGGATGAAGGTAVVMAGDRNAATLPSGTIVTIRLAAPVGVEVEKR